MKTLRLLALLCPLLLASVVQAEDYESPPQPAASGGVELTPWLQVRPFGRETVTYTSNLFFERNHRSFSSGASVGGNENDVVFRTMAGFDVIIGKDDPEGSYFQGGYAATLLMFVKHPDLNTVEHRTRWTAQAKLMDGKLTLASSGRVAWQVFNTDPQFAGRIRNMTGDANASARYDFNDTFGILNQGYFKAFDNFPREIEPSNVAEWGDNTYLTLALNTKTPEAELLFGGGFREWHYYNSRAAAPDFTLYNATVGARLALPDLAELSARIGYEVGVLKRRRRYRRLDNTRADYQTPDGWILSANLTVTPLKATTISLFYSHQLAPSAQSAFQRRSAVGGRVEQELFDFKGFLAANYSVQAPKHQTHITTQSYSAGVGWVRYEWLEVGLQGGYTKSQSRRPGYEFYTISSSVTVRY